MPCELCLLALGMESGLSLLYLLTWTWPLGLGMWDCMCPPPLSLFHADGDVRGMTLESAGSSLSQLTLVSTLYFRSMWQKKFSLMDSQMLPFTTPEGSTLKVPTMHHTAEVNYGNCP